MNIYFHDAETGIFHHSMFVTSDESIVAANTPAGHKAYSCGEAIDVLSQRMDIATGNLIDYQPPQPTDDHEWNAQTKRWQLSAVAAGKLNRSSAARARVAQLEASQHRHVREHCLGIAGAAEKLKVIDDEIFSLRSQL
jgi:hypothetical protein